MAQGTIAFDSDFREGKCAICDQPYRTMMSKEHAMSLVCMPCRKSWGVNTDTAAVELIGQMDGMSVSDREKLVKGLGTPMSAASTALARPVTPAPAKVDLAKVQAAVRELIDYGLVLPLTAPLEKQTNYVIAKNGLFEVRHTDVLDVITVPKTVIGVTEELKEGIRMNLPLMPFSILSSIVAFFRQACKDHHGSVEAYVQVWWNTVEKSYHLHVPEQQVSGGSVHHNDTFDKDLERDAAGNAKWIYAADIHSHGSSMSAFFSGTDDGDDKRFPEGHICGVIGKVNDVLPEWKWRIRVREGFVLANPDTFFDTPDTPIVFNIQLSDVLATSGAADTRDPKGRVRLWCPVDPFADATFPKEWLDKLKGWQHQSRPHGGSMHWAGSQSYSGSASALPSYIYIVTSDGKHFEEFKLDASDVPVSTKKLVKITPAELKH